MFAVVRTGGKQYKVSPGDVIVAERLAGEAGSTIELADILMVSDGAKLSVGTPTVAGAKIAAEVVDQCRGEKVIILKFRRRKRSERRTKGHRQEQTILRVMEISAPGMTTAKAEAKPKKAPKQAATAETDTADAKPAKKAKATGKTAGGAKAKAKAPAKKTAKAKKE